MMDRYPHQGLLEPAEKQVRWHHGAAAFVLKRGHFARGKVIPGKAGDGTAQIKDLRRATIKTTARHIIGGAFYVFHFRR